MYGIHMFFIIKKLIKKVKVTKKNMFNNFVALKKKVFFKQ